MKTTKVHGNDKRHKVLLYALSTCMWCKKTKSFLKDSDIEYEYVDVDLCSNEDKDSVRKDILSRGGRLSYPTTVIDDAILITGFHPDKLQEALQS